MVYRFLLSLATLSLFVGACNFTQKIQDGPTAFERKQYDVAIKLLKKEFKKEKSRVEQGKIAFLLAESYRFQGEATDAIDWYEIAYNNQYGSDALKQYAFTLKQAQRYTEAAQAFKELGIEIGSPYEYRKEITACKLAAEWQKKETKDYQVEPVDFNTSSAEYAPTFFSNGQLVITSDRPGSTGDDTYAWTGNSFSDLYLVDTKTEFVSAFDTQINSEFNEGTAAFNEDFSVVYFSRCFSGEKFGDNFCKLMVSKKQGEAWTVPAVLPFVEENVNYGSPALSSDGQRLYFSANHPEGWGGYDLYYVDWAGEEWGEPKLMSRSINTPEDEQFPSLDGDTLYFASRGHTGMGGLDIYRTYRTDGVNWSPAQNLKPPLNSGSDDFGIVINPTSPPNKNILQRGFFTSNRDGSDDIFSFEKLVPPTPPPPPPVVDYELILDGYLLEKIYQVEGDPNSKVLGRKPLRGTVEIQIGELKERVKVDGDGYFSIELNENKNYSFLGSSPGYLTNQAYFSTFGVGKDPNNPVQRFEVEIVLDKIYSNQEITLENIYYDFDRWEIRPDAEPTLNKLAENLKLNPEIRIQMGSHTDCRGNDRYNEDLSQKRAESAVDFLISKGIEPDRLSAKGYGEDNPSIDCICSRCSEDEHQKNRRTTFAIIEY